ncbi:MAG: telomere binding protein [Chrysothrix sp. TS-e1954]|nr:MAG: telomere binding protein [Chrysothrix sp. TS-e1954]
METLREIGSCVSKLRSLLSETKKDLHRISTLQDSLSAVLEPLWISDDVTTIVESPPIWREFLSLVASGKVLSTSAESERALEKSQASRSKSWVGDGRAYARWIGKGVVELSLRKDESHKRAAAQLCGKAFSLGYKDDLVKTVLEAHLLGSRSRVDELQSLISRLARHEQRYFLHCTMNYVCTDCLPRKSLVEPKGDSEIRDGLIPGCVALVDAVISAPDTALRSMLSDWLLKSPGVGVEMYRVALAALPEDERAKVLQKSWEQFGDDLYIKHTPIMQQEALTQVLLLAVGYVHRVNRELVSKLARSSLHTKGVSTRLGTSSQKARLLGMVVGTAVSMLVDGPDTRMTFEFEKEDQDEVRWYQSLITINDRRGTLKDLSRDSQQTKNCTNGATTTTKAVKKAPMPSKTPTKSKIMVIEEVTSDDDDLIPYAKPDSDPEDDTDDATMVDRNKLKPPVYIRDLISGLQDTENHDRYRLALITAPNLVRRKADFGSEVKDRAEELAQIYAALSDPFEFEDFHDLRMQGLVAVLTAQPRQMGPWYARTFFTGDYSIGQRVAVLTAMGLIARELAGYEGQLGDQQRFPTKTLPERMHKLYADSTEVAAIAQQMEETMLQPVSTKKRRKLIKNDLAKLVAESFFFPLTGRWQMQGRMSTNHLSNMVLPHYLRTLALILSFSGTSSTSLPQMTSEFWDLLLSLRSNALSDVATLEAMLFSFLTILNVNEDKRRIATDHSKELIETHEWVNMVFERLNEGTSRLGTGPENEEQKCKTLAAGVLVATKEVVDAYQRLMVGDMLDM